MQTLRPDNMNWQRIHSGGKNKVKTTTKNSANDDKHKVMSNFINRCSSVDIIYHTIFKVTFSEHVK